MKINILLIITFGVLLMSCSGKNNKSDENQPTDSLVVISVEQFKAMNMAIGNPTMVKFASEIAVQGVIEPSPNAKAYVTSPIGGVIKSVKVVPSSVVNKGQALIAIDGPEILNTQTLFVETYNQHRIAKANFERISQLSKEGIASQKELLQAESEYRILDAKLNSHRILLGKLGLNPDEIIKGEFSNEAYLVTPIEGTVARVETSIGKPVTTNEPLAEVINTQSLLLKFFIFLNQVNSIKPGQKVEISLPGGEKVYGSVISVGLDANTENKAVECFASISLPANLVLISGTRVSAKVFTNFVEGWALPRTALHEIETRHMVYTLNGSDSLSYFFKKVPIQVGLIQDTIVQVFDSTLSNVLVKGGYELTVEE